MKKNEMRGRQMSQTKPMKGFNFGKPNRQQQSKQYRKIFDTEEITTGNILYNRRNFTKRSRCPICKHPPFYVYDDNPWARKRKMAEHIKEKHSDASVVAGR